ncbi:uncharacterized protein LOC111301177 isoform X4 [Durio zibethinus]|uniref:Uncharacterized protein LOC111301177 isoform X4 n=1 Tax=Durio zibethinus TaxID=66656 RepID=A0A6P5ZI28_DURZI|nr:uncharacterized protein LOC111301177 isoform X4 [Durio zibethinus]
MCFLKYVFGSDLKRTTHGCLFLNLEGGIRKVQELRTIRWSSRELGKTGSNKRLMLGVALEMSRSSLLLHYLSSDKRTKILSRRERRS